MAVAHALESSVLKYRLDELIEKIKESNNGIAMMHIKDILAGLERKGLLKQHFKSTRLLLLAIIRKVQLAVHFPIKAEELETAGPCKISEEQYEFAKAMSKFALRIYDTSYEDAPEQIAKVLELPSGDDVTITRFDDDDNINYPKFLILVDHRNKAVLLAIRGTHEFKDVLTDMLCADEKFLDGFAHVGILQGASKILRVTKPGLVKLLADHPTYKFVITGHSLGAGTAVLIALETLLGEDRFVSPDRVKCIALAPPPVFRPLSSIPDDVKHKIEIYIHGHVSLK